MAAVAVAGALGCTPGNGPATPTLDPADAQTLVLHQNRGIGMLERYDYVAAVAELGKAYAIAPDWVPIRFHLALAYLHAGPETRERSLEMMMAIIVEDPTHVHALYAAGILLENQGATEEALPLFGMAWELSKDPIIGAKLGVLMVSLDLEDEALAILEDVHARRPALVSPVNQLMLLHRRLGNDAMSDAFYEKLKALKGQINDERKWIKAGEEIRDAYGNLGRYSLAIHDYGDPGTDVDRPIGDVSITGEVALLDGAASGDSPPGAPAYLGMAAFDFDSDGDLDLFLCRGTEPSALLRNDGGLQFTDVAAEAGVQVVGAYAVAVGELDVDPSQSGPSSTAPRAVPDLVVALPGGLRVFRNRGDGTFDDSTVASGLSGDPGGARAILLVDADQEGDLDLFVSGGDGTPNRLYANKGPGVFVDATEGSGLAGDGGSYGPAAVLDADEDYDLDLLVTRPDGPPVLFLNDRLLRFRAVDGWLPADLDSAHGALVGDLDGDSHEDVVLCGESGASVAWGDGGTFTAERLPGAPGGPAVAVDGLLRGRRDLVFAQGALLPAASSGRGFGNALDLAVGNGLANVLTAELDGGGAELVVHEPGQPTRILKLDSDAVGSALVLDFQGVIRNDVQAGWSNLEGRHAWVEVKSGPYWQAHRIGNTSGFGVSAPTRTVFGVGDAAQADFVRTLWPDAVQQGVLDVPVGAPYLIVEEQRRPDSCPLLFVWDGERYAWVTDFLGAGGLGFLIAPGVYAAPDVTESVKVPAELVAPDDEGRLVFKLVEAMEEVVYLDDVDLLVVDHPADVSVYPDERFTGEKPFADGDLIAHREEILPVAARDGRGRDVLGLIERTDRRYSEDPDLHPRLTGAIFESALELDFGDELAQVAPGDPLVLHINGWIEYGYTRTSVAAAGEGFEYVVPTLEAWQPSGDGGGAWTTLATLGYPAGFPRVMTLDVTGKVSRETPRLRIRTSFEVYWDRVWLAPRVATNEVARVTKLSPVVADLRRIGYPREFSPDGRHPRIYDYGTRDEAMPWKTVEGDYTRFGDVLPLLDTADDRYVIYGKGEEIDVRFETSTLPALPDGWTRSYVLAFDGWCKGQELYIAHGFTVEPLPFHGMSHYPYRADEAYPDDEEHRAYRAEWNTRRVRAPARR